jgi:hypothetical protein
LTTQYDGGFIFTQISTSSIEEINKSQLLRLWDVFLLGPILIYISKNKSLKPWERNFLMASGALTMIYNGKNYLLNARNL